MSGYLTRLGMHGGTTGQAQFMQPLVHSASPVVEHDQRIGMADFAGFVPSADSLVEADLETGGDLGETLVPPPRLDMKRAAVTTAQAIQPKSVRPPAAVTRAPARPEKWTIDPTAQNQAMAPSSSWRPLEPQTRLLGVDAQAVPEVALRPDMSEAGMAAGRVVPGIVHTRHVRNAQEVDALRLEPSPASLAEPFPPLARASEPAPAAYEGPSVVIGRINVEVVPPPASPPSSAAAQAGLRTAASVSVIGPLSGGIRQGLRLSLRHR